MSLGLLGHKLGMTELFDEDGNAVPVTVIHVGKNHVTQIKTAETDGYQAVQLSYGERKVNRVNKPSAGHFAKAGVPAGKFVREFLVEDPQAFNLGQAISIEVFNVGQKVDVQGTSIGKGYAGTIKRHNFASGRASHGNSRSHNVPGSIGQAQDPGRVFPGKRMTGHMGDETCTIQSLVLVGVDEKRDLLFVKGAVPGAKNGFLIIKPAVKAKATPKQRT